MQPVIPYVVPVKEYSAGGNVIKAGEQAYYRCFAGTRGAGYRNARARGNFEGDAA